MLELFSKKLEVWLKTPGKKTLGQLESTFAEKGFAVAFLLLMITSALPIPTGGITHVFAVLAMLLAVEMIVGRRQIWVPKRWRSHSVGNLLETKALPKIVKFIRWFEKHSQRRLGELLIHGLFLRLIGVIFFVFALGTAIAPPFSGLDTLPALGAVIISLSLIQEDVLVFIFGVAIGVGGIVAEIMLGRAALHLLF